jgi:hypothetical protein
MNDGGGLVVRGGKERSRRPRPPVSKVMQSSDERANVDRLARVEATNEG